MVAGVIDILILLAAAAAIAVVVGHYGGLLFIIYLAETNYIIVVITLLAWFGILTTADILLVIGAAGNNTGLIMVWLIVGMINIVFLFLGWTSVFLFFTYSSCSKCWSLLLTIFTGTYDSEDSDIENADENGVFQLAVIMWLSYALIIIIPIYYIYFWVTVKSHLENLIRVQNVVQPIS